MPVVMLPAKDVADVVRRLLEHMARGPGMRADFQASVQPDMRRPGPAPEKLAAMLEAAEWLEGMEIPDAQMGLTIEEARILEPMLPRYG